MPGFEHVGRHIRVVAEICGVDGRCRHPRRPLAPYPDPRCAEVPVPTEKPEPVALVRVRVEFFASHPQPLDCAVRPARNCPAAAKHKVPARWARRLRNHLADVRPRPERRLRIERPVRDPSCRGHLCPSPQFASLTEASAIRREVGAKSQSFVRQHSPSGSWTNDDAAMIRIANISTGPEQALAIADGWVTGDEFRAAISATRECITGQGVELTPEPDLSPAISALTAASGLRPDIVAAVVRECSGRHLDRVGLVRVAQQPRVDPNSAGFLSSFSACLADGGLPPETPFKSFDDLVDFADRVAGTESSQVFRQCQRTFPDRFALAGD